MRSSISSSEKTFPKKGIPRALIAGVGLVLLVEIVLNFIPPEKLLGYGAGLGSYYDVAHSIEDLGAAEVAILGTSRGRESIVIPLLKEKIEEDLGQDVSIANYSCAGSHADEMLEISKRLMAASEKPKIVLYFLSPGMLQGNQSNFQRLGILGKFPDLYSDRTGQIITAQTEKPFWSLRKWIDRHYLTFRHRHRFRHILTSIIRGREPLSTVNGDFSTWQKYAADRSLESHPVSDARVLNYINRLDDENGHYVVGETHLQALEQTIRLFQENDVPIVVLAASLSPNLEALMPERILGVFQGEVEKMTEECGVHFWWNRDLGLELGKADFREQSHLNLSGATKVTEAVYERFIKPELSNGL